MMNRLICKKRYFLLLEVLIAFTLVVMAFLPMLYPHYYLLRAQREFIHKVDLDHLVNLAYADVTERLYRNEIPFFDLLGGRQFFIDDALLKRVGMDNQLPYKGTYKFSEKIHKPRKDEPVAYSLYLINLDFKFEKEKPAKEVIDYHYKFFVVRDLGGSLVEEDSKEDKKDSEGKENESQ